MKIVFDFGGTQQTHGWRNACPARHRGRRKNSTFKKAKIGSRPATARRITAGHGWLRAPVRRRNARRARWDTPPARPGGRGRCDGDRIPLLPGQAGSGVPSS